MTPPGNAFESGDVEGVQLELACLWEGYLWSRETDASTTKEVSSFMQSTDHVIGGNVVKINRAGPRPDYEGNEGDQVSGNVPEVESPV